MMISEFHLLIAMAVAATIFTAATMLIFLYCRQLNRRLGIIECGLRVQSDAGVGVGRHVTGLERELAELKAQVVKLRRTPWPSAQPAAQVHAPNAKMNEPHSTAESKLIQLLQANH